MVTCRPEAVLSPRRRATRERLVAAASDVFASTSVEAASVEQICEAAGFTRGAFYSNFEDKDELLVALVDHQIAELSAALEATPGTPLPAPGSEATADDIALVVGSVLDLPVFDADYYLRHTEIRLRVARTRHVALVEAFGRLDVVIGTAIIDVVARCGRRSTVPATDLLAVVEGVLSESHRRAFIAGDPDRGRLARDTMPAILLALTVPAQAQA